jgi:APA family basic amino acid/polyamine antiporter
MNLSSATSLVALGIGAIIGAGIFTLTGGAALVYSFVLDAIGVRLRRLLP